MITAVRVDPTDRALERIDSLDAARGLAFCGIVLLNIYNFSMPPAAYFNPLAYGYTGLETMVIWAVESILAQDAFRAIFAILFGAEVATKCARLSREGQAATLTGHEDSGLLSWANPRH